MKLLRTFSILLIVVAAAGCGGSGLPELGTVSGKVTHNGAAVAQAIVTFTPVGEGRPSVGETDEAGVYSLNYLPDVEGALVGQHKVTVERQVTAEMDDLPDDPSELAPGQTMPPPWPAAALDGSIIKEVKSGENPIDIVIPDGEAATQDDGSSSDGNDE